MTLTFQYSYKLGVSIFSNLMNQFDSDFGLWVSSSIQDRFSIQIASLCAKPFASVLILLQYNMRHNWKLKEIICCFFILKKVN